MEKLLLRDYGEGLLEITWSFRERRALSEDTTRGQSEDTVEIREASVRRARRHIKRKTLHGGLDHLLSLDFKDNVTELRVALRALRLFCDRVQAAIPGWKYLATRERQKRGAWHFHMAVKGRQDVKLLRSIWWSVVGERKGNIDVQEPRARKTKNRRVYVAEYISKYIGKDLEDWQLNKKMYYHSKNVEDPPVEEVAIVLNAELSVWDWIDDLLQSRFGGMELVYKWSDPFGENFGFATTF